eukprot:m.11007 g.11007  ORF g.11007 m.11007 type:complete len:51 (-) comp4381_c0_seq2:2504-2656(-)
MRGSTELHAHNNASNCPSSTKFAIKFEAQMFASTSISSQTTPAEFLFPLC